MRRRDVWTALALAAALTTASATVSTAPPAVATGGGSWRADLSIVDADDVGVTSDGRAVRLDPSAPAPASARAGLRTGFLDLAPHDLAAPANTFAAAVRGDVPDGSGIAVDVRGALGGDRWTEWVEAGPDAPAVLPAAVRTVQVRLNLTAADRGPTVHEVALTPSTTASTRLSPVEAGGRAFRIFATREGLVGGTTANGHVIVDRDHFTALPSRRGLSTKDNGTYSVQVCADNGRCEWAPVWDVGPWNTRDDHWNPPDVREMWQDVPQGKPQAQAAYQDAYNGGKDQFGRRVANPAGIDLADGTFWDGLGLADNAWVTVTYLWTGSGPTGYVSTAGGPVDVRGGPSSAAPQAGLAADHAQVAIECAVTGEPVAGTGGASDVWFRIAADKYLPKAHLTGVPDVTVC